MDKNILKRYFKKYVNYFEEVGKKNPTLLMFDTSLDVFKDCLITLEYIYMNTQKEEDQKEIINNELILVLYCIAYIKMYLYKCIHFAYYNRQEFMDFKQIMEVIILIII